jgi:hypothetical protein
MLFDSIDISTLNRAAERYLGYKNDQDAAKSIRTLCDTFHESSRWEAICGKMEDLLIETIAPFLNRAPSQQEAEQFHIYTMGMLAIGFAAGYEAGLQGNIDQTVAKLGGLS